MRRRHWFQFISHGVLALFMGIMLYVTYVAFSRHSGSAGLDMAYLQKIRYEAFQEQPSSPSISPIDPL